MSFTKKYFDHLYPANETIDGDYNSKDHAKYLSTIFKLMGIHTPHIFDFGFGKGTLLRDVSKTLGAVDVRGCDISPYAYKQLSKKSWAQEFKLEIAEICELRIPKKPYHLGLCNSVLQYVSDDKLEKSIDVMAKSCKYLYLHVPTREDYRILKSDLNFEDPYAFHRYNDRYTQLLKKRFTFVSWGLLESKKFAKHKTSPFMDSIYRL